MDRLGLITKAVENYNTKTAQVIERVVQENGKIEFNKCSKLNPMQ